MRLVSRPLELVNTDFKDVVLNYLYYTIKYLLADEDSDPVPQLELVIFGLLAPVRYMRGI